MSQFEIIEDIATLIKGDLNGIFQEAQTLETQLADLGKKVESQKGQLEQYMDTVMTQLSSILNVDKLTTVVEGSKVYQQLSDIPIDFSSFLSLPQGFDPNDPALFKQLIKDKIQFLKNYLSNVNDTNIDFDGILNDLQKIIITITTIPTNLDTSNVEAVMAYKLSTMEAIKPTIFDMIEKLFNVSLTGSKLDQATTAFDNAIETILNTSSPAASIGDGVSGLEAFLTKAKPIVPKVSQDLSTFSPALGNDVNTYGTETIDYLQTILPQIENELSSINTEQLDLKTLIDALRKIFPILNNFTSEPTLDNLADLLPKFTLVNITQDEFVNQLEQILTFPNNQSLTANTILTLLQQKIPAMYSLLMHVQISDPDLSAMCKKIGAIGSDLLSPFKDMQQLTGTKVISGVLESISDVIANNLTGSGVMVKVGDVSDKLKVVWDFLDKEGLFIPIKFKLLQSDPLSSLVSNQINNPSVDQNSVNGSATTPSSIPTINQNQPNESNTANNGSPPQGNDSTSQMSWGTYISGLIKSYIAQLPNTDKQSLAMRIVEGNIEQVVKKELLSVFDDTMTQSNSALTSMKNMIASGSTKTEQVVTLLLNQLKLLVESAIAALKNFCHAVFNMMAQMIQFILDLVLVIKVPKDKLTELIPGVSELTDVNLICLFLAMPKWAVEKLLNTNKEQITGWVNSPTS